MNENMEISLHEFFGTADENALPVIQVSHITSHNLTEEA